MVAGLADADVIVHGDAKRLGDLDDRLRHLDISVGTESLFSLGQAQELLQELPALVPTSV